MPENRTKKMEVDEIINFTKTKSYEFKEFCGNPGSFGVTIKVFDPTIEEYFAIKKYSPQSNILPKDFYDNFKNEIKLMYNVYHKNIVRIYNYYLYPSLYKGYIVMEYIDGQTINNFIDSLIFDSDAQNIIEKVFEDLIDAFVYLEENGIIHRDIRTNNILVTNNYVAKVIDFGFGKVHEAKGDSYDSKGQINRYGLLKLPQEYYDGKYTSLTDMFYLGELLYRLLDQNMFLDSFIYKNILDRMMEVDPKNRYKSFSELKRIMQGKLFGKILRDSNIKKTYQEIMKPAVQAINYVSDYYFNFYSLEDFMAKLKNLVENNQLEDYIFDYEFATTVLKSNFTYFKGSDISYDSLSSFYDWLSSLNDTNLEIVYRNIKYKFTVECRLDSNNLDLPF